MFPIEKFRAMIDRHEGNRLDVYKDTEGYWTVGRGFNLEQPAAKDLCSLCGIYYEAVMALKGTARPAITEGQSKALFDRILAARLLAVRRLIPGFDEFSEDRQLAIMDVAWVGMGILQEFTKMRKAIEAGDWQKASTELLDSKLAAQWRNRAIEDANLLISNC